MVEYLYITIHNKWVNKGSGEGGITKRENPRKEVHSTDPPSEGDKQRVTSSVGHSHPPPEEGWLT